MSRQQNKKKVGTRTRHGRYALNAAEYFLAYTAGFAAIAATYVVAGGFHGDAIVHEVAVALSKLIA